jgi:putative membrane protein
MSTETTRPGLSLARYENLATLILCLLYAVGLAGHLVPATRGLMSALTPYVLLLCGLAAVAPAFLAARRGVWLWAAAVFAATFLLEAAGTATGRIFGPYTYGPTLGWKLLEVPVVIAFNWLLVILGFTMLVRRRVRSPLWASLLAAALTAGFDFLMEPIAIRLDYWTWQAAAIPLQNYLAWFLIALASSLAFTVPGLSAAGHLPARYVLIQAAFFAGLRIGL